MTFPPPPPPPTPPPPPGPPPMPPGHGYVPPQVPAAKRSSSLVPLLIVGAIGVVILMAVATAAILIVLMNRGGFASSDQASAAIDATTQAAADAAAQAAAQAAADAAPAADATPPTAPPTAEEVPVEQPPTTDAPPATAYEARVRARRERALRAVQEAEGAAERGPTDDGARRATVSEPEPEPEPVERAIRVGGNIRAPEKTRNVQPVYPQIAQQARVEGMVIIEATIDRRGRIAETRVLRSIPLLDQAALDAVRQWEYEPTRLNGVTVPVMMTVTVNFRLGR